MPGIQGSGETILKISQKGCKPWEKEIFILKNGLVIFQKPKQFMSIHKKRAANPVELLPII